MLCILLAKQVCFSLYTVLKPKSSQRLSQGRYLQIIFGISSCASTENNMCILKFRHQSSPVYAMLRSLLGHNSLLGDYEGLPQRAVLWMLIHLQGKMGP